MTQPTRDQILSALRAAGIDEEKLIKPNGLESVLREAGLLTRRKASLVRAPKYAEPKTRLAAWLIAQSTKQGWHQSELAKRLGVARQTVSVLLTKGKGESELSVDLLLKMSKAFNVHPLEIMGALGLYNNTPDDETLALGTRIAALQPEDKKFLVRILHMIGDHDES